MTLTALAQRQTLRLCTAGSVDDGKSTFVGRLLHDTKSVLADQLASVERTSADRGFEGLDLSLLVDGLRAEREQGITIDVAYRYFATDKRAFILADTPGHVQYTRNTVTGVSTSEVVVLLVDARHGVVEQTRRHAQVAALLGVHDVILAVNKIDLVGFDEATFRAIEAEFHALAAQLGIQRPKAVPISALRGDNVAEPSSNMSWYEGPTVLSLLEHIELPEPDFDHFRFPIQYVIRDHASDYRGYAGQVHTGRVRVGDEVLLPGHRRSTVVGIDGGVGDAGDSIVLRLADDIDLCRGDLITDEHRPEDVREFEATVVSLHEQGLRQGQRVAIRYGSSLQKAKILEAPTLELNDIAKVRVLLARPLPIEAYAARGKVGAMLFVDEHSGDTLAAGLS
ncbi:sulfate adenylyltransferase subunit 1 [Corynebacterium pseudopelargi]|uniref:sulfate adenylyltransferase n=1 Tax=Corynebacterium pseudopelargi TaxID=2080757 RepID=A0A3G6IS10_9CORY|nr:GTP-binding protein [Corynebacterium pseudopelargi]AZA08372.1 Bifunctional enzyme CysN/CysC [Corynebacterium pseudopelargi]